jgi:hypothetical protein
MQTIFEKCLFKENGKLSKLFCRVLRGLNLPAGPDNPQNKIMQGIRPQRTRSCRISDPTEVSLVGYQTQQNNGRVVYILKHALVLRGLILRRTMSCGSDTPLNKVLWGIRPCRTKSCGVSNPAEQHSKKNISANSKNK